MRIDGNQAAQPLPESGRTSNAGAANAETRSLLSGAPGEDQARISDAHAQVQVLVAQAAQLPEIRQEKVNALRQAILGGGYQPGSSQVAEAVFLHMLPTPAA
jgi:flagellar biosynthesis anti-sigma factor FlgM